jgi:CubicO group peptidase (beta-lactamase class C family)
MKSLFLFFRTSGLILGLCLGWSGCMPLRFMALTFPDEKDPRRFPQRELQASAQPFQFHPCSDTTYGERLKVNDWTPSGGRFASIREVAAAHATSALLIVRNDTLLYEGYFNGYSAEDPLTSYSIAKSYVSALVGVALEEGRIRSVDQPLTDFFPEWKNRPGFAAITIQDLLNHTSGLRYRNLVDGHLYYGNQVQRGLRMARIAEPPGQRQFYLNLNAQLLGMVVERAVGRDFVTYFEEKIWKKIGAEGSAFWSVDRQGQAKTFCCLNAQARDFAKLGRLYLNGGHWEGEQVVPRAWVDRTLRPDTTRGGSLGYHYSWYLGSARYGDFMANGLYKQFVYVCPDKHLVIVRLGLREPRVNQERVQWEVVFRELVDQL